MYWIIAFYNDRLLFFVDLSDFEWIKCGKICVLHYPVLKSCMFRIGHEFV